jgi:DNA-binding PadR family transcriptional regulator
MEYSLHPHGIRGFPVEFAVLGFLLEEPRHGYALRSRIEDGLGPLWRIASSQLYKVLQRLEAQGWVRRAISPPVSGPPRSVYSATDVGAQAFHRWITEPVRAMRNVRVEFVAKLYFARLLELDSVSELIDRQLDAVEQMHRHLLADDRDTSDDVGLNAAWLSFQQSTLSHFAQWLRGQRSSLQFEKEPHT